MRLGRRLSAGTAEDPPAPTEPAAPESAPAAEEISAAESREHAGQLAER